MRANPLRSSLLLAFFSLFIAVSASPAVAPPLPAGTPLLLAPCDGSDSAQVFAAAGGAVLHVASGLCVAFDGALDTSPLVLASCSAGAAAQDDDIPF